MPRGTQELERVTGIEPVYSAWKAAALPLCYTRILKALVAVSERLRRFSGSESSFHIYTPAPRIKPFVSRSIISLRRREARHVTNPNAMVFDHHVARRAGLY